MQGCELGLEPVTLLLEGLRGYSVQLGIVDVQAFHGGLDGVVGSGDEGDGGLCRVVDELPHKGAPGLVVVHFRIRVLACVMEWRE